MVVTGTTLLDDDAIIVMFRRQHCQEVGGGLRWQQGLHLEGGQRVLGGEEGHVLKALARAP